MEIVKQIRVITSDEKCKLKETSSFHMNLHGFKLPLDSKDLYVKVDNIYIPRKKKRIIFSMYYGKFTYSSLSKELKEYSLTYYSLEDLCMQLNHAVWNDFIAETLGCKTKEKEKEKEKDVEKETVSSLNDEDMKEVRKKMGGKALPNHRDMFNLKYENNRHVLNIGHGNMYVITTNIGKLLGFETELLATVKNTYVICKNYVVGEPVSFLNAGENICNLTVKNLVNPVFRLGGGNSSVICCVDVEKNHVMSYLCKIVNRNLNYIEFSLLNDDMNSFFTDDELDHYTVRFTLNIMKSV